MKQGLFRLEFSNGFISFFPTGKKESKSCTLKLDKTEESYLRNNCEIDKKTGKVLRILTNEESFKYPPEKCSC